jgi:hypothetical protein
MTHLAKAIHAPMVTDAYNRVARSERIFISTLTGGMHNDRWWPGLNDMYWDLIRSREGHYLRLSTPYASISYRSTI